MGRKISVEQGKIRAQAWVISVGLHVLFGVLIAIEVHFKAQTILDPICYFFCVPGLIVGIPIAMLVGRGGGHGEVIFFGILFGLPANVVAYYWISRGVMRLVGRKRQSVKSETSLDV